MNETTDRPLRQRKARDRAFIVPLFGLMMLMPPVVGAFALPASVLGVPLIVVYLFAVWAALIVHARFLARALGDQSESALETAPESQ